MRGGGYPVSVQNWPKKVFVKLKKALSVRKFSANFLGKIFCKLFGKNFLQTFWEKLFVTGIFDTFPIANTWSYYGSGNLLLFLESMCKNSEIEVGLTQRPIVQPFYPFLSSH